MSDDCYLCSNSTSAHVDIKVSNDAYMLDAIQFGALSDGTAWSFPAGTTFEMNVTRNRYDTTPLLTLTIGNGRILILDATNRIIQFFVTTADLRANLPPGVYVFTFIMIDPTNSNARTQLMHGDLCVGQGPTYP